jgi:glycosyltransferase involved in cell wall biosynthesis
MLTNYSLVSIIIPTKNCANSLESLLISVKRQNYIHYEIIVVDNNSSDQTKKIALKAGARVYNKGPERGAQKNFGALKAKGKFIFFIDADMELETEVVGECVKLIQEGNNGVIIPERSVGEGFWNKCVILERSCYVDDSDMTAARFLPKKLFADLGGFDENLVASGDDMDLSQRLRRQGGKIGWTKSFIIHYEGPRTPWSTVKKWRYYGRDMHKYYAKNPKETALQYLPIRRAWIKHWKQLVMDPLHALGFMWLKLCNFIGVMWGQIDIRFHSRNYTRYNPYQK